MEPQIIELKTTTSTSCKESLKAPIGTSIGCLRSYTKSARIQSDVHDSDKFYSAQDFSAASNPSEEKLIEKYRAPVQYMDKENDLVFQESPKSHESVQQRNMSCGLDISKNSGHSSLRTLQHRQSNPNFPSDLERINKVTNWLNSNPETSPSLSEKSVGLTQEQFKLIDLITECSFTNRRSDLVENCRKLYQNLGLNVTVKVEKLDKYTNTENIDTACKVTNTSNQDICSNCVTEPKETNKSQKPDEFVFTSTLDEEIKKVDIKATDTSNQEISSNGATEPKETNKSEKPNEFVFSCELDDILRKVDIESFSEPKRSRQSFEIDLNPPKRPKLVSELLETIDISDSSSDDGIVPESELTQPIQKRISTPSRISQPINQTSQILASIAVADPEVIDLESEEMDPIIPKLVQSTPLPVKQKNVTNTRKKSEALDIIKNPISIHDRSSKQANPYLSTTILQNTSIIQILSKTNKTLPPLPAHSNKLIKLTFSQLAPSQIGLVVQFCNLFKVAGTPANCKTGTHLIIQTDDNNCVNDYTTKYVCAVSHGKWVVSFKWIQDSLDKQQIQAEVSKFLLRLNNL